jgi:hypothetical protein
MPIKKDNFIRDIVSEVEEDNVAVFSGAGLSMPDGFVSWKGLLKPIAEELGLDVEKEYDLIESLNSLLYLLFIIYLIHFLFYIRTI